MRRELLGVVLAAAGTTLLWAIYGAIGTLQILVIFLVGWKAGEIVADLFHRD
jgi:hypothetical protein